MVTSAFRVVSRGELLIPSACARCGNGTREEGFVDFDLYFEYHGQFYLCMMCWKEALSIVGGLDPEQAQFLIDNANAVGEENAELRAKVAELNGQLEQLRGAFSIIGGGNSNVPDTDAVSVPAAESVEPSEPDSSTDGVTTGEVTERPDPVSSEPNQSDSSDGRSNSDRSKQRNRGSGKRTRAASISL